jgi:hypothetical protein
VPQGAEGDGHRGVDVRAGEVSGRIDHRHDHEPEGGGDAERAERAAAFGVDDDRAAAGEHERKRGERLGQAATR